MGFVLGVLYLLYLVISIESQLYHFSSDLDAFYFFVCLIAVARTSNTMLNKSGESGHPCLVPNFGGKTSSFSPLSIILAVILS